MKQGFTLIELLIVIAIIGILGMVGLSSYFNAIKSGKDARRKTDLESIQKTLELYYQDNQLYPPSDNETILLDESGALCHPDGCDVQTYIQKFPHDPTGSNYVYITVDQTSYQLYSCIENANDKGPGVNQDPGYSYECGENACSPCKYGVSSTNTTP